MSGGIDYSKWDRMQFSDDDDDGDSQDDPSSPQRARVTRLEQASRVTLAPDGQVAIAAPTTAAKSSRSEDKKKTTKASVAVQSGDATTTNTTATTTTTTVASTATTIQKQSSTALPMSWTDKGGCTRFHDTDIVWTQDRESVTLRVLIPTEQQFKGWQVRLEGRLAYTDRHVAVSTHQAATLEICHATRGTTLLPRTPLPHAIHKAQGEDDDDVDWTIERANNDSRKAAYITVSLYKASPMPGVVVWWKRPLQGVDEIDISSWRSKTAAAANFQQAWDEAHAQFRAKMAAGKQNNDE